MDLVRDLISDLNPSLVNVFLIVLATMTVNYVFNRFLGRVSKTLEGTRNKWDDAFIHALRRPAGLLIWVLGFSWAAEVILQGLAVYPFIEPVRYVAIIILLGLFVVGFMRRAESSLIEEGFDTTTVLAVGKLLRVSVIITAALMVLQTLGVSISGVLAFGGIGGIAVGFAARDLLANFFGGIMIYMDRPFVVGDWIRSPDRELEGTVEDIGWRLTVIRTFDQRPLYVPNATFASIAVENPSRMRNRRIYETIGIRYEDAALMEPIVREVREMLQIHPDIDPDRTLIVNFNGFGASSLDFFIYTFTKTTDWVEFHGEKHQILLQVLDIIDKNGAEIAFPTSTIHLEPMADSEDDKSAT